VGKGHGCKWGPEYPGITLFSSVQSHSHVQPCETPWTAARQTSQSITNSHSLLKLMSIESVMPSNHLILCRPLLLPPSIFPSIRGFSNESVLCIRWPKYWGFSFGISTPNEYLGLISFRMDWLDLFAVQGTLKSLLQHHSSKASILQCSALFIVQLSHPYMTTGKTIALTRQIFVGKVMPLLFNMLPKLVITFLPRSKCLLISWLQSPSAVIFSSVQFSSVAQLCLTLRDPMNRSTQASLSITNSRSSLRLTSIKSVMPSSHLILCRPLLLLPPIPPSIRVFSNESTLRMRWPNYWSFSFSISPSNEHPGLISFRMDWMDLLAAQRTLKSLLQYHSSNIHMQRVDSLEKTLMLGGIGGKRRRGRQRMRCLDGITDSMDMSLSNSRSW